MTEERCCGLCAGGNALLQHHVCVDASCACHRAKRCGVCPKDCKCLGCPECGCHHREPITGCIGKCICRAALALKKKVRT